MGLISSILGGSVEDGLTDFERQQINDETVDTLWKIIYEAEPIEEENGLIEPEIHNLALLTDVYSIEHQDNRLLDVDWEREGHFAFFSPDIRKALRSNYLLCNEDIDVGPRLIKTGLNSPRLQNLPEYNTEVARDVDPKIEEAVDAVLEQTEYSMDTIATPNSRYPLSPMSGPSQDIFIDRNGERWLEDHPLYTSPRYEKEGVLDMDLYGRDIEHSIHEPTFDSHSA